MRHNANSPEGFLKSLESRLREHTNPNAAKMRNGSADPEKARTLDAATGAELAIALKGAGGNPANLGTAMRGYSTLTGIPNQEALVKARAACASHCQKDGRDVQGRTSCKYCNGEGFISKSSRENQPSRSVNKLQKSLIGDSLGNTNAGIIKRALDSGDPDRIAKCVKGFRVGSVEELIRLYSKLETGEVML